jgi:serine/threonine protein phosphatase 1
MQKLIGWFSTRKAGQNTKAPRRRVDLGDAQPPYPVYAIGDVHGCLGLLKQAEETIARDMDENGKAGMVVLLGDFVDRGPASSQVIDHLIKPSRLGLKRLALCGNHDDIFLKFIEDPDHHRDWLALGGEQTLMSYGIDIHHLGSRHKGRGANLQELLAEAVPSAHREFLETLPVSLRIGQMIFVHAGIRPGVPLADQTDEDLMWIRDPFLKLGPQLPHTFVIHGHTPNTEPDLGPSRVGIDTGAFYTGRLTVLKIDGNQTRFL